MPTTLINVSNRLPVTVGEQITKSSGGLVAALEGLSTDEYDLKWIGWPGAAIADPAKQRKVEKILTEEHGCIPVFLSDEEIAGHYEGFSNSSVWPVLHYMANYMRYDPPWWDHYRTINQRFADKAIEMAQPGDLVWVHDYQLMLVPAMLHERMPDLKIGFFLHTPFPSFETFRCHPKRRELVAGMLGANLIGFHTFGYMRHFRSTVLRLLGLESEITRIRSNGHTTVMGVFPIGISAKKFEETLDSPEFKQRRLELGTSYAGKRVVLSVERMDYTKGILHRLDAIERFLENLEDRDSIKFVFVSVPSREEVEEYKDLRAEAESRIGRINGQYSTLSSSPIRFIHASVSFTDLCALYATADVGMVTPLIDGMNLVAKEYIACQRDHHGVLMLSEFAGAAEELSNATLVNPYDAQSVAQSLTEALRIPEEERRACNEPMRDRVMKYNAQHWARTFIEQLGATVPAGTMTLFDPPEKAVELLAEAFSQSKRIALFLDYDGTLREIERDPRAAKPTQEVIALLELLEQHENVDVTIISGRTPADLEAWFGDRNVELIAEHGAAARRAGTREWEQLDRNVSYDWKDEIRGVLRLYEQSTPGSSVEEKRTSLGWHHRNTDPEFGTWKANELMHELSTMLANEPVQIRHGRKIVEVTAEQVTKAGAVRRLLSEKHYDFMLCAGDDQTDESMFEIEAPGFVSIKVGGGPSRARFRLRDPAAFRKLLRDGLSAANPSVASAIA